MKNTVLILMAAAGSMLLACQPPAPEVPAVDKDAALAEIQALEDAYAKASNEKNAEALLSYYADDAVRLPDEEPTIKGKEAIRKHVMQEMASDTSGAVQKFKVEEIFADGNLLVEVGSSTSTKPDGTSSAGKYVAVYEKRDGKYICILDIWNSDDDDDDDDTEGDDD